jgi:hypothetical protein
VGIIDAGMFATLKKLLEEQQRTTAEQQRTNALLGQVAATLERLTQARPGV